MINALKFVFNNSRPQPLTEEQELALVENSKPADWRYDPEIGGYIFHPNQNQWQGYAVHRQYPGARTHIIGTQKAYIEMPKEVFENQLLPLLQHNAASRPSSAGRSI